MGINLDKFVHTGTGKIIMSILLGFGLASLFRRLCNGKNCLAFRAPHLEDFKDKIFKIDKKCVKYEPVITKCSNEKKIIYFE